MTGQVRIRPVRGLPEIGKSDDLAAMVADRVPDLDGGDIVVVSSKAVSKSEGRVVTGVDRRAAAREETVRVVAERGETRIVVTRHGFVMAAAGVDASNVAPGSVVLLPEDPDASARSIRRGLGDRVGARPGVVVTDTFGRPWRLGQTDLAVGAAGVRVSDSYHGRVDGYGNELAVTAPALADELAAAADLVKGKLSGVPVAVVSGLGHLVTAEDGPGVRALVRDAGSDLFRLGTQEAMRAAVRLPYAVEPVPAAGGGNAAVVAELVVAELVDAAARTGPCSFAPVDRGGPAVAVTLRHSADRSAGNLLAAGAAVERLRLALAVEGVSTTWVDAGPDGDEGLLGYVAVRQ